MVEQVAVKVPFTLDTVSKCLCPGCPVQTQSKCVAGLKSSLTGALKKSPLRHDEIPADYCVVGKATCADIDTSKDCLCGDCAVYSKYNLAKGQPGGYYCSAGAAR